MMLIYKDPNKLLLVLYFINIFFQLLLRYCVILSMVIIVTLAFLIIGFQQAFQIIMKPQGQYSLFWKSILFSNAILFGTIAVVCLVLVGDSDIEPAFMHIFGVTLFPIQSLWERDMGFTAQQLGLTMNRKQIRKHSFTNIIKFSIIDVIIASFIKFISQGPSEYTKSLLFLLMASGEGFVSMRINYLLGTVFIAKINKELVLKIQMMFIFLIQPLFLQAQFSFLFQKKQLIRIETMKDMLNEPDIVFLVYNENPLLINRILTIKQRLLNQQAKYIDDQTMERQLMEQATRAVINDPKRQVLEQKIECYAKTSNEFQISMDLAKRFSNTFNRRNRGIEEREQKMLKSKTLSSYEVQDYVSYLFHDTKKIKITSQQCQFFNVFVSEPLILGIKLLLHLIATNVDMNVNLMVKEPLKKQKQPKLQQQKVQITNDQLHYEECGDVTIIYNKIAANYFCVEIEVTQLLDVVRQTYYNHVSTNKNFNFDQYFQHDLQIHFESSLIQFVNMLFVLIKEENMILIQQVQSVQLFIPQRNRIHLEPDIYPFILQNHCSVPENKYCVDKFVTEHGNPFSVRIIQIYDDVIVLESKKLEMTALITMWSLKTSIETLLAD